LTLRIRETALYKNLLSINLIVVLLLNKG